MRRPECPLPAAVRIAEATIGELDHACHRIQIAGSVRRRQPYVKDLEIVCIPRALTHTDLFGQEVTTAYTIDDAIAKSPILDRDPALARYGDRYKRLIHLPSHLPIDLFLVLHPAQWGLVLLIRTGSGVREIGGTTIQGFGPAVLRRWKQVTNGGYSKDGCLHLANGTPVATPEEEDVFRVCHLLYVPPQLREDAYALKSLLTSSHDVEAAIAARKGHP